MGIAAAPSVQIQRCTFGAGITHINLKNKNKTKQKKSEEEKQTKSQKKMFTTGLELAIASLATLHEGVVAVGPLFDQSALHVDEQMLQNRGFGLTRPSLVVGTEANLETGLEPALGNKQWE